MPNKHKAVQCLHCDVVMRSDNLAKHVTRMHPREIAEKSSDDDNKVNKYVWRDKGSKKNHWEEWIRKDDTFDVSTPGTGHVGLRYLDCMW